MRDITAVFNENNVDPRVYKSGIDVPIFRSIGKVSCHDLKNADNFSGTGSLINSCHIITNHHFWRECMSEGKNIVTFEYDHDGARFRKTTSISLVSKGNSSELKSKDSINDSDWAIYRLNECAPNDVPKFNICDDLSKKEMEGKNFILAGLSFDRSDDKGLSVDEACSVYPSDSGNFVNYGHNCASRSKTSGAPLFYFQENSACLVGIHSSCYTNSKDDKCDNGIVRKFYEENTFNWAIPAKFFRTAVDVLP